MRRALPHAALLACLLLPSAATAQDGPKIQPGASMEICTLNFVYDGLGANAGKVYIGTAAHCVDKVGDTVNDGDGNPIGTVAFFDDADVGATDYAFIEVLASELGRVDPAMKGHPEFPTGYTVPEDTASGDLIQISGYGIGFGETQPTQEERRAVLRDDDEETYQFDGPSVNGDSGGPLVHVPTGKALGIVSRYGFPGDVLVPSTDYGPTLQGILKKAAAKGFPVSMRLAGQAAPAATPPAAAPQQGPPQQGPPASGPAPSSEPAPAPAPSSSSKKSAARKRAALKRCRKAARKIRSASKRRKALKRCERAAKR